MKYALRRLAAVFLTLLIGTGLDWLVHQTSADFGVPSWYFTNKILYGTFWAFIILIIAERYTKNRHWQAFWMALIVAIILQLRYYFILHYSLGFVLFFLVVHFIAFLIPAWFLFRLL